MLSVGSIVFADGWLLGAVAMAPALWLLLRLMPPSPRRVVFPPFRLLAGLTGGEQAKARTPWWMMVLRVAIAALVVAAAAGPVLNPVQGRSGAPLILTIDDGWASAPDWQARKAEAEAVLRAAERDRRAVRLLTTAPPAEPADWTSAAQALERLGAMVPRPWPTDRAAALRQVESWPRDRVAEAVWLSDGLDDEAGTGLALARSLQSLGGGLRLVTGAPPVVMLPPQPGGGSDRLVPRLKRLDGDGRPVRAVVRAVDDQGRALARTELSIAPEQTVVDVELRLPGDLRNRIVRLDLENQEGAATTVLLDERWRRRPVGLAALDESGAPLLAPLYFVERGLAPFDDLRHGEPSSLATPSTSVLILADIPPPGPAARARLAAWVEAGGVLIRFAGPHTAQEIATAALPGPEDLLPVTLRGGGRALGGAMSWTTPQGLAPFPDSSPFAGLAVPADLQVTRQVLAEPGIELAERTWASLTDGTPLVTGRRQGKGWLVLVHTTANADWSNLPMSGLFVDMLRRLTALSSGISEASDTRRLPPQEVMDGFGRLSPPAPALSAALPSDPVSAAHPPGFYGHEGARVAVNLSPGLPALVPLAAPSGATAQRLGTATDERDLRGPLLAAALALAIADTLAALALRGLLTRAALVLALTAGTGHALAQDAPPQAALEMRLAWVRTGIPAIDAKSAAGLKALSVRVGQRSTAILGDPVGLDLSSDAVLFYPLLYWPVTADQPPPAPQAAARLNAYLRSGGMIVFDTGADLDQGAVADTRPIRRLTEELALPPLVEVQEGHVLARAFYLLTEMPGRWTGPVWAAQAGSGGQDGVSPVVVGTNDWAGAWADDGRGRPLHTCVPGGERQRELAFRFGVNLVMYALTGNYKADQVHLPAIMERLGR
jgi:hypothetical protein